MPYAVPKLTDFSESALDLAITELQRAFAEEAKALVEQSNSPRLSIVQKGNLFEEFRNRWQARKSGIATQVNDVWLREAPREDKRAAGQAVNKVRWWLEGKVAEVEHDAMVGRSQTQAHRTRQEHVDVTLPGIRRPLGAEHPVIKTMNEIVGVFRNLGYSVEEGPEIETDYYNFEALNFPLNHPARDTQDTLFIAGQESKPQRDRLLLRTHTSPVQIL